MPYGTLSKDRGLSSLPINLIYEVLFANLIRFNSFLHPSSSKYEEPDCVQTDLEIEELDACGVAENIYLALLAIRGFSSVFPYALFPLKALTYTDTVIYTCGR